MVQYQFWYRYSFAEIKAKKMSCEHNCQCHSTGVSQSLDEMDFERGIWYASQYGDIQRVKTLLANGVNPDQRDSAAYTALHYASRNGHLEICQLLLRNGADINAQTKGGATALCRAAAIGAKNITEFLLLNGADPNKKDSDGKTALHRAAENKHKDICQQLLNISPSLKDAFDNNGVRAEDLLHNL